MAEFGPKQGGMDSAAQEHEEFKAKVNLSYANRITNPHESSDAFTGVCDVDKAEDAKSYINEVREHRKNKNRRIYMGAMATRWSLNNDDGDDCPNRNEIANAFTDDPDAFNCIHFADLYKRSDGEKRPWKSGETTDVPENLELCVKYGGENLHAIQLDLVWPKPEEIKEFKERHPNISIILQVGKFSLAEVDNKPLEVIKKLREYGGSVDYVLLDMSMGKGIKMDGSKLVPLLSLIQFELPDMGLAVAGGLGPDSIDLLKSIAAEFPNISIDAQGRLKPDDAAVGSSGHYDATTPADPEKTKKYIREACALLDEKRPDKGDINPKPRVTWI